MEGAEVVVELRDEVSGDVDSIGATLWVHVGIACADVISCTTGGRYSAGLDHGQAIITLEDCARGSRYAGLGSALSALVAIWTLSAFSDASPSAERMKRAERGVRRLMAAVSSVIE